MTATQEKKQEAAEAIAKSLSTVYSTDSKLSVMVQWALESKLTLSEIQALRAMVETTV